VLVASLAAAGCYEPEFAECQVRCDDDDVCAVGQVCGDDGLCASADLAGACEEALAMPTLRVRIVGRGRIVDVDQGIECEGNGNGDPRDCSFAVPEGRAVALDAVETHHRWEFTGWTTANCAGEAEECRITLSVEGEEVAADFTEVRDDGDENDDDD
jgi:hypothetical protein